MSNITKRNRKLLPLPLWVYVIGILFAIYIFYWIVMYSRGTGSNIIIQLMEALDIGVHEVSHNIAQSQGSSDLVRYSAGFIGQLLFVFVLIAAAFLSKKYFSAVFAGLWLSRSVVHIGTYVTVSRSHAGSFVSSNPFSMQEIEVLDGEYILEHSGLLQRDVEIGNAIIWVGLGIGILSILFGILLIVIQARRTHRAKKAASLLEEQVRAGVDDATLGQKVMRMVNREYDTSVNHLMLDDSYGKLVREKGATTTALDVHLTWCEWAHENQPSSSLLVPFDQLPDYAKSMNERYAEAIRVVSQPIPPSN